MLQVLLVHNILIGGEDNVESRLLRDMKQITVLNASPSPIIHCFHKVVFEEALQPVGDVLIKENVQPRSTFPRR